MPYDPHYHYEEDQRKQRRYNSLLPVFLVAIVLFIAFGAAFVAYQRHHAKPKPYTVTAFDAQSGYSEGHAIDKPGTDRHAKWAGWSDWAKKNIYLAPCKEGDSKWDDNGVAECVKASPKLHKRKHYRGAYGKLTGDGGWLVKEANIDPSAETAPKWYVEPTRYDFSWHFINTIPMEITCSKLTGIDHGECTSRPLTPDEIKMYQPVTKWETTPVFTPNTQDTSDFGTAYNPLAHDGDMGSGSPMWNNQEWVVHDRPTTPQDITNLMEQIAPTPKPHGVQMDPDDYPTIAWAQIQLTQKQKDAYASNAWMKPCGPDNHADGCYVPDPAKPDCKMPADIDVCPQTIDPNNADDKKGKP